MQIMHERNDELLLPVPLFLQLVHGQRLYQRLVISLVLTVWTIDRTKKKLPKRVRHNEINWTRQNEMRSVLSWITTGTV